MKTKLCKCGRSEKAKGQSMCNVCRTEYQRKYRKAFKEKHGLSEMQVRYKNPNERAYHLLLQYKKYDVKKGIVSDDYFDKLELVNFLTECIFCGDREQLGLDRIDNIKGHTRDNVQCVCAICNRVKSNQFTNVEMSLIGRCIRRVKQNRT